MSSTPHDTATVSKTTVSVGFVQRVLEWFSKYKTISLLQFEVDLLKKRNAFLEMDNANLVDQVHGLIDGAMRNAGMAPLFSQIPESTVIVRDDIKTATTGRAFAAAATAQQMKDEILRRTGAPV